MMFEVEIHGLTQAIHGWKHEVPHCKNTLTLCLPYLCWDFEEIQSAFLFFSSESWLEMWSGLTATCVSSDLHSPCVDSTLRTPFFPCYSLWDLKNILAAVTSNFAAIAVHLLLRFSWCVARTRSTCFVPFASAGGANWRSIFYILPPISRGFCPSASSVALCGTSVVTLERY